MRHTTRAFESVLLVACCCSATVAEQPRSHWWPFGQKTETAAAQDDPFPAEWSQTSTPSTSADQAPASSAGASKTNSSTSYPATAYPSTPYPSADTQPTGTIVQQDQDASSDYSADEYAERRWMFQSPLTRISWPRIHIPTMPRLPRPQLWPRKNEVDEARNAWVQTSPDPARPSPLQAVRQGAQRVGESTRSAWRKTVDVLTPGDASSADSSRMAQRETQPFWRRVFTVEEPAPKGPRTIPEWLAQERLEP